MSPLRWMTSRAPGWRCAFRRFMAIGWISRRCRSGMRGRARFPPSASEIIQLYEERAMSWTYSQSTGRISHNGRIMGMGYSGMGNAKNKPDMETFADHGPIPRGTYRIGSPHHSHKTGAHSMALTPIGHNAHGRDALLIHGDSKNHPGNAPTGCIILPLNIRTAISSSGDNTLQVVR